MYKAIEPITIATISPGLLSALFHSYLFHFFILAIYDKMNIPATGSALLDWCIKYVAALLASLAVSVILTKGFDRPMVERLKRML